MKKYLITAALSIGSLAFSQNYPFTGSGNSGYSQQGYGNINYGDENSEYNYPEDYYYEYPSDYYPAAYYQNYYSDYRRSITGIDWNRLAMEFRLDNYQMQQIVALNSRFGSFYEWNSYYGTNPDRWYYDRFYALQRILGPQIFVKIQNRYYGGYSPVHYFENYRRTYYQPRYVVLPKYRNIDVGRFRIDRNRYFQSREYPNNNAGYERRQGGFQNRSYEQNRTTAIPDRNNNGWRNGLGGVDNSGNVIRRENSSDSMGIRNGWKNKNNPAHEGSRWGNQRMQASGNTSDGWGSGGTRSSGGFR